MKTTLAIFTLLFSTTAMLAKTTEISVPGGAAIYLPDSETMVLLSAVQDVRCPSTVDCVWEGTIRVELTMLVAGDVPIVVVLCNVCHDGTRKVALGNSTISLMRLEPGRDIFDKMARVPVLADYTVVLAVDRP